MTTAERSITLPADLASVRTGRHFARDVLTAWDLPQLVEDAQLGASELVTNAVRHAATDVVLTVIRDTAVRIEVHDEVADLPATDEVPVFDPTAESGRGLQIVAAISDDWGVSATPGGKVVWFTLRLPDEHATDADVFSITRRRDEAEQLASERAEQPQSQAMEQARGAR